MMKLAINGQQLGGTHSLAEIIEIARSFNINAMEIWPHNLVGGETPEESQRYEQKDVETARQLFTNANIEVACVTLGFSALRLCLGSGGIARCVEALNGAVDAAATLGAPIVNCYLDGIPARLFIEIARQSAEYAGSRGVTIVLENEAHDDSATPAGVRAIVEAVGSPHLATEFDPCNYYHSYEEPYPAAYELLKEHIRYVHLKGGVFYDERWVGTRGSLMRGRDDRHIGYVPLPESAFNIDGIIRRLAHDGYTGYVTLEPHVPSDQVLDFYRIEIPYMQQRLAAYS